MGDRLPSERAAEQFSPSAASGVREALLSRLPEWSGCAQGGSKAAARPKRSHAAQAASRTGMRPSTRKTRWRCEKKMELLVQTIEAAATRSRPRRTPEDLEAVDLAGA
ncbi:hypothetical protein ACU4GD_29945 [Cupriavidus basilensis]